MSKLKTELKHWDKHLSKLYDKRNFCLDIGSYTGKSTCWMLNNLCSNPYSKVYSIDRWKACDNCSEYKEYTDKIEKEFDKNVEETGRQNQNVKMNLNSNKAIIKLKNTGIIIFDFIFIDASHEPNDILSNAILSWEILNENGILIFDDYEWDNKKNEEFKPKYAIDTFMSLYNLQLEVLHVGYHYIVKKINKKYTHKEKAEYYELFDEINNFRIEYLEDVVFDDVIEEELDFKLKIKKNIEKYNFPIINKDGIKNYDLLKKIFNINIKYDNLYLQLGQLINIYSKLINNNLDKLINYNKKIYIYKYFSNIDLLNQYKSGKNILLNYNYDKSNNNKYLNLLYKKYITNPKIINLLINKIEIYNKLIKENNSSKYDIIYFGSFLDDNNISSININLLYHLCVALNTNKINGNLIIIAYIFVNYDILYEFIYILKKFYRKVIIRDKNIINIGSSFYIIAENFIGINENKINSLIKDIYNKINHNNNNIKILKNDINFNFVKNKIKTFIDSKKKSAIKILILYDKIYNFIKKNNKLLNNNIKLTLFKLILNNIIIGLN